MKQTYYQDRREGNISNELMNSPHSSILDPLDNSSTNDNKSAYSISKPNRDYSKNIKLKYSRQATLNSRNGS